MKTTLNELDYEIIYFFERISQVPEAFSKLPYQLNIKICAARDLKITKFWPSSASFEQQLKEEVPPGISFLNTSFETIDALT